MRARGLILEMIGATNWWLDKNGRAHMVFHSHGEFAQQQTGIKFLHYGPDSQKGWKLQGKAYETMYRNGWVRVSYKSTERRMQIEFRGSISRPAMEWLQDQAFERQAAVVDDTGRIYADFRPQDEQGGSTYRYRNYTPEHIVEMLLNETDPKELAMRANVPDYDRTVVWIRDTDEEVPVGFGEHGFFWHDAAYTLANVYSREHYEEIMSTILAELDGGKESGKVLGVRWVLRPHSIYEPAVPTE